MAQHDTVHLPDLSFVQFCQQKFGINRGVFNTIDLWFFEKGVQDIVKRRNQVLDFLKYIHHYNGIKSNGKIKIGNNGLSSKLNDFWMTLQK